jgi:hypothetical protein
MTNLRSFDKLSWVSTVVVGALLLSCGGDDNDDDDGGSPNSQSTSAGGSGSTNRGSAKLTIGDDTWEFDAFGCAFGHDATRSDTFSFSSDARGQHTSGARLQMQANITDESGDGRYEGQDVGYEVFLSDIDNPRDPAVKWSSTSGGGPFGGSGGLSIKIDGDDLTVEGDFDDELTDEREAVPGTLVATCGSQSIR